MLRNLLILGLIAFCSSQKNDEQDILLQIFGKPPSTDTAVTQPTITDNKNGPSTLVPGVITRPQTDEDLTCTTTEGEPGECVPYYQCNVKNNTIIDDGVGLIDIRTRDGPCLSYMDTCCLLLDKRPPDNPITPRPDPQVDQEQRQGCGWRNPKGVGIRTTGEQEGETKFGEFPWMCAIVKIEPVNEDEPDGQKLYVFIGGGSLIHPSIVLTAAHYVADTQNIDALRVRAGEWDTQSTKEIYPYQDRSVSSIDVHKDFNKGKNIDALRVRAGESDTQSTKEIYPHQDRSVSGIDVQKDFNKGNLFYDVAVLFLTKPMDLAPNVQVACLPQPRQETPAGTRCFATGWGKDKFGKQGRYQVILKKVEVPVVDHTTCRDQLRKTRLGRHFELHTSFMCAGGEPGVDTCRGDGGSPLSCPIEDEPDRYMQSGIVAWGIGCGENNTPGVYVNVGRLRAWIDDKVAGKGFDPKVYEY